MPALDLSSYNNLFLKTANEHVVAIEKDLSSLLNSENQKETLDDIYRRIHSLEGSSSTMGFLEIFNLCKKIDMIIHPDSEVIEINGEKVQLILSSLSYIKTQLTAIEKHKDVVSSI